MPSDDTRDLVDLLPWSLRRDTERYLGAVRDNGREIFHQARVGYTPQRLEQLLLLAAVQKVWATINTQAWIVDSSLRLIAEGLRDHAGASDPQGLQLGRATYSRTSDEYVGLQRLRAELDRTLRRLEIRDLIRKSSLNDLAKSVGSRKRRGR
jgi:hypothetical protein